MHSPLQASRTTPIPLGLGTLGALLATTSDLGALDPFSGEAESAVDQHSPHLFRPFANEMERNPRLSLPA